MVDTPLQYAPYAEPDMPMTGPVDIPIEPLSETGDVSIDLDPELGNDEQMPAGFGDNLALALDASTLAGIALDLMQLFDEDERSREDWRKTAAEGIDYLGLRYEERTQPWPKACGVFDPMITEALIRFQSNAIMELFPSDIGPIKTKIIGDITPAKEEKAARVAEYMNYVVTEVMEDYRLEKEKLLWEVGFAGCCVTKAYRDPEFDEPCVRYIPAEDFVMPYGASSLRTAPRYTHRQKVNRDTAKALQASGFYRNVDLGDPYQPYADVLTEKKDKIAREQDARTRKDEYEILEMHTKLDIGEGPLALPYVVHFERYSQQVLAIYRNWDEQDPKRRRKIHFSVYRFIPGPGAYGYGLIHIIGSLARGSTSLLRQLVDAGTQSNMSGGWRSSNARVKDDQTPISPGEWRTVDAVQGKLAELFFPLPTKEPSAILLQLRQDFKEDGRRLGSIADLDVGDMSAQAPVGTTLAIIERSLKIMSAVQSRIHTSFKDELRILQRVIREMLPTDEAYPYDVYGASREIKTSDFQGIDVVPVSNPNSATNAERILRAQASMQIASSAPQLYDLAALHRDAQQALGTKNIEKILPDKGDIPLMDPVQENGRILNGQPVKAYEEQNHDAHIQSHMAYAKDPKTAQLIGQNPQANALYAAFMAHVAEHAGFLDRVEIEQQLGFPLPGIGQPLPPDIESSLSLSIANAYQRVTQAHQAAAQQQQQQQQAQDPVLELQRQENQIKSAEVQQKAQSDREKLAAQQQQAQQRDATERLRIAAQTQLGHEQSTAKSAADESTLQLEVKRLTMEANKTSAQVAEILARIEQMQRQPVGQQI